MPEPDDRRPQDIEIEPSDADLPEPPKQPEPSVGRYYSQSPPGPVEPTAVLRHKVQPPPLRTSTLSRQRLIDRLAWATQSRVTLLIADAGYGKSTLLADFSRRFDGICLWYSLESDDLDWLALVPHLVAAVREAKPSFGTLTTSLLRAEPGMSPPKSAVIAGLLSELTTLHDRRVAIIFDDVHSIEESPDANQLLERLVEQAPPSFSFVFAGRRRPAIAFARWAGRGQLTEITTDDLRFTREDTARLFADSYGQALDPEILDELDRRTQGWAACLQLFSTLISGLSPVAIRAAARSLSGSTGAVFDYLAQEVMAKLAPAMQAFLIRASLLQIITPALVEALFPEEASQTVAEWTREADALGLMTRAHPTNGGRQFHPLLRDYLLTELRRRHSAEEVGEMHARVARDAESDPLTACYHYIEAGMPDEASRCLGASTLQTLGSGLAGSAARLASRLNGSRVSGAVAVIEARRLLEEGEPRQASDLLASIDLASESAGVRAAIRHTALNIQWRTGGGDRIGELVDEILGDPDTPAPLRNIALMFRDGSSASDNPATFPELCRRLERMAASQQAEGYGYYAAISAHNAAIAALQAGDLTRALDLAGEALTGHQQLAVRPPEYYSTCSVLAHVALELGRREDAENYILEALSSGREEGDVPAVIAFLSAVTGDRPRARRLLASVDKFEQANRMDMSARVNAAAARAYLQLPDDPHDALSTLAAAPTAFPLDFEGDALLALRALARLLGNDRTGALRLADDRLPVVHSRGSRLAAVRLALIRALAMERCDEIIRAIQEAQEVSPLALLEAADAVGAHLHLLAGVPEQLEHSIAEWPQRWLPVLRRVLELGEDPRGVVAAKLLDAYGEAQDIGRLRAYERMYRRRTAVLGVGKALARRVSPPLVVHDLGQVSVSVGDRQVNLSDVRRRSGAVLMYLITRPNYTATREQLIEEIWPDADVASGSNSLNQSLYFLRREFDPWYEDDVSVEYVSFAADLVSLDRDLTTADSGDFMKTSRALMSGRMEPDAVASLLDLYRGQFAPDFEYEEWAIGWRTRVHAAYLDFGRCAIQRFAGSGALTAAVDVTLRVLAVDQDARDFERALVWLYWRCGARSAAETQYAHFASAERADGFSPPGLTRLVSANLPMDWGTTPT